ncbi:MAG: hypothetical protein ACOX3K_02105 [Bacilli bacterium]
MKKKHFLILLTSVFCFASASVALMGENHQDLPVFGEGCQHHGYHYAAKAAKAIVPGHQEFWACCTCHEKFLVQPLVGTWEEGTPALMSGGIAKGHLAYLPSEAEELQEMAKVKYYTPKLYYATKQTYEIGFDIGTVDMIATDADVAAAYNAVMAGVDENTAHLDATAKNQFISTLIGRYGVNIHTQVLNSLTTFYGTVKNGILGTVIQSGNWITVGSAAAAQWVSIDPLNTTWGSTDNRWWNPYPFVAKNIIDYADELKATYTSLEEATATLDKFMVDVARSSLQFIAEAEFHYAESQGQHIGSEWWFLWTYYGASGYAYTGVMPPAKFDPASCTNYRLCSAVSGPDSLDSGTGEVKPLATILGAGNWLIKKQISAIFEGV